MGVDIANIVLGELVKNAFSEFMLDPNNNEKLARCSNLVVICQWIIEHEATPGYYK
jgi:hypothetical protein